MQTNYLVTLILLSIFSSISVAQEIGFPLIRNYTPKEYNSSSQVFGVTQSSTGIMYFGVSGGVMEYDGVNWRIVSNDKHAYVYNLASDKKGRVYVGANDEFGYLDSDNNGNTIYKTLTHLIKDTTFKTGAVWSVKLTSECVYFRTYNAILQYTPSTKSLKIYKADVNRSFSVDFVYKDIYYTRMYQNGLMKIVNNQLIQVPESDFFKEINTLEVLLYDAAKLLIPTRYDGLYLYELNKNAVAQKFNISNPEFLADNNIYSASVFQKEKFILGSLKKGAVLVDKQGTILQHYGENNLLQNKEILKIAIDSDQNIWMGLNIGISKTEHSQDLSYWDKNAGLEGVVESVIRYENTVYIATSTKVYFIDKKNQIQEVQNIPTGQSWCFLETKNIKSLLAGVSDGIYEIKNDKAVKICTGSHVSGLYQSIKHPDRIFGKDGNRLISLKYGKGKWKFEVVWSGINDQIDGIIEDKSGDIWIGISNNGIKRITPDYDNITRLPKVRHYKNNNSFNQPFFFKNKIIWGSDKGLFAYNSQTDQFESFCGLGKQFCNGSRDVASLLEMSDGKIWICPSENKKGDIGYLQPNNKGSYNWVFAPFRRIPQMALESFYVDSLGIAWIGGSEGLYRYDPRNDTKNYTQKFNCLIRKIITTEDSVLYGGNTLTLKRFKKLADLKFKYNNLTF